MNAHRIIVLVAYFLAAVLAATATKGYYATDKRMNERPFMMGMRYGRADKDVKASAKHVIVAPRNDKFFLASRYGKRSSEVKSPSLVYPVAPLCGTDDDLTCTYTGISNIYRCVQSFSKDSNQNSAVLTSI